MRKIGKGLAAAAVMAALAGGSVVALAQGGPGYGPMGCDPFLYHAYLAGQLKRMRFGFSVVTGSLHHPVRFVERMNLLDQLTKGRLLVGIGSGTTILDVVDDEIACIEILDDHESRRLLVSALPDDYMGAA